MTVFFEYVKDQDRYVHAILSDAKPMKQPRNKAHMPEPQHVLNAANNLKKKEQKD